MIWFFTPYSFEKKLFQAYDAYMQVVQNEADWVCLMDGDAAFLLSDFGHQLQEYIDKYPATGMFTCYGSRCPYGHQVKAGVNQASDSIRYIFENTKTLRQQEHLQVTDLNKRVAGHLMLIQKKTWTKYRHQIAKQAESANIQAVDTAISDVLLSHNKKILLMQGMQVFHYYRQYSMTEKHILSDKLTVVIRTHDRPMAFKRCIESVRMQSHKNIDIVVGVDTPGSMNYVFPYNPTKIMECTWRERTGHTDFPANEYISELIRHVTDGYILVLDDDNYIADPRGVEKLFSRITKEYCIYIIRYRYPDGRLFPNDRQFQQKKIENGGVDWASCVFHARFKNVSKSKPLYNADFYFIQALVDKAKVTEFIDLPLVHTDTPGNDGKTKVIAKINPLKNIQLKRAGSGYVPGTMDVVYVLGTGSRWNDNELRFSLRSLEKNLLEFRNVFIVGECPGFLQNVIHIPATDIFNPAINADGNIITKVLAACTDKRLSDDFLFINDDHLILQPVNIADVPPLHKGDMATYDPEYWKLNYWRGRLKSTMQVLQERDMATLNFDCHTPIVFNKEMFFRIMNTFDYRQGIGYTMKSLYGNTVYPDAPFLTDQKVKIFKNYTLSDLRSMLSAPMFMSFNDQGINNSLKWWLIETFCQRSSYEKDDAPDRVFELHNWFTNGKSWSDGVQIFRKYHHHANLQRMFDMGETTALRKKLEFKLMQTINEL